jgi:hypothetical protein
MRAVALALNGIDCREQMSIKLEVTHHGYIIYDVSFSCS